MTRAEHAARPRRESLSKRLGVVAKRIKARDGHACAYCGSRECDEVAPMHLDHLLPRVDGGADVAENLVLACRRCNTARQNMSLPQWAAYAAVKYGLHFTPDSVRDGAARPLPEIKRRKVA